MPIAHTGSYATTSRSSSDSTADLAPENLLGLPRLALALQLAHAGDDEQARLERRRRPAARDLVRLAEVLAPLGVADDRRVDPELAQHRRGDLAGEGALALPVHVLRADGHLASRPGR